MNSKPKKLESGCLIAGVDITKPEYGKVIKWYNKALKESQDYQPTVEDIIDILVNNAFDVLYSLYKDKKSLKRTYYVNSKEWRVVHEDLAKQIHKRITLK